MKHIYTIDIGGSSIKHSIISFEKINVFKIEKLPVIKLRSKKFSDLEEDIFTAISKILNGNEIKVIAICTTGSVDKQGIVLNAGHFQGYTNINWRERIITSFPSIKEVVVANDGKASAWAEYRGLDNSSIKNFIHLVLGTGIGGASIINEKILEGEKGFSGYLGHIKVTPDKTITCSCGKLGCLETIASARAIIENYNNSNIDVDLYQIIKKAKLGEEKASLVLKNASRYLGQVIGTLLNVVNPGVVTLGGGMIDVIKDIDYFEFLKDINLSTEENSHRRVFNSVEIKYAKYGNDGGMLGVGLMAFEFFLNKK